MSKLAIYGNHGRLLSAMKTQNVLRKVPLLLNSDEPEQAIKVLRDAIQEDPENPHLYTSLGRVYQRLKSPQDAVPFFRRSIELFKAIEAKSKQTETLNADDFEYLEERNETLQEQEFTFPELSIVCNKHTSNSAKYIEPVRPELQKDNHSVISKNDGTKDSQNASDKPVLTLKKTTKLNRSVQAENGGLEELDSIITIKKTRTVSNTKKQFFLDSFPNKDRTKKDEVSERLQKSASRLESFSKRTPLSETFDNRHKEVTSNNSYEHIGLDDEEDEFLVIEPEEPSFQEIDSFAANDELSEETTNDIEQVWAGLEEPLKYELSEEDYYDDFNPEFIESFEELSSADDEDDELIENSISLWQKAERVATEFILHANWSIEHLDFMTNIFCTKGFGQTKKALHFLLERGLNFDELYLADCIRSYWKQNENYWISFNGIGAFHTYTSPLYKHMSWRQALSIVRLFSSIPQPEEIEFYLEEEFSYWFNHLTLRRTHPVFIKYLAYKKNNGLELGMVNYGDREWDGYITYDPLLGDHWSSPQSNEVQKLRELGINLF